jgi:hypothetical protein
MRKSLFPLLLSATLSGAFLLLVPVAHAQNVNGTLSTTRFVLVNGRDASSGQVLEAGARVQTQKRSRAEVALGNGDKISLLPQTDVVLNAGVLALGTGAMYVKTTQPVLVQTQETSISITKGEVAVTSGVDGSVTITALTDPIEVERGTRKRTLKTGQQVTIALDVTNPKRAPRPVWGEMLDAKIYPWWLDFEKEAGVMVTPGSAAGFALRTAPLPEFLSDIEAMPPNLRERLKDADVRRRLATLAQNKVAPVIDTALAQNSATNLANYVDRFGNSGVKGTYGLSADDTKLLNYLGVGTVRQLFGALSLTSVNFGVNLKSQALPEITRQRYTPSSLEGPYNNTAKLMDGADSSTGYFAIGLLGGFLLDGKQGLTQGALSTEGDITYVGGKPTATGIRAGGKTTFGKNALTLEFNSMTPQSGEYKQGSSGLSVALVERKLQPNLTVFAGRKRFYSGPALLNRSQSQLVANRFSALGATLQNGKMTTEFALLHDSNAVVQGAQSGWLASTKTAVGGGFFGAQAMSVGKVSGKTGFTASFSQPLQPGTLDAYGEIGTGPDKESLITLGAYLPGLYQSSDIDAFIEYSKHGSYKNSLSVLASRPVYTKKEMVGNGYVFASFMENSRREIGFGVSVKYNSK